MPNGNHIFYDAGNGRYKFYRKATIAIFVLFLGAAVFTVRSTFSTKPLEKLNLPLNIPNLRSAPNNAGTSAQSIAIGQQNNQPITVKSSNNPVRDNYSPKTIAFYVNWDETSFTSLKKNLPDIDELVPEWLHLISADGTIVIDNPKKQDEALSYIRQVRPDLPIIPLINNFNPREQKYDDAAVSQMLVSPEARSKSIEKILTFVTKNNLRGINIDFESILPQSQPSFILFIKELSEKFHSRNLLVSVDIPLVNPEFNAGLIGQYADFVVLMAYNENSIFDNTAGPIASQSWYEAGISQRAKELDPGKLVISVGNFGYDWKEPGDGGTEVTFQESIRIAKKSESQVELEKTYLNPHFKYYDDNGTLHHLWYLDATTVFNQVSKGNTLAPRGYALWRLGSEDPSVWEVFRTKEKLDSKIVENMRIFNYGYDIDYEGRGGIIRISENPQTGQRELAYKEELGMITGEKIISYPSAYLVKRWGGEINKKIVLTFDDGPDPKITPKILDILKSYKAPATFFVIGLNASRSPGILHRIIEEGHLIGNHTLTHPNVLTLTEREFKLELNTTQRIMESATGRDMVLLRPPYAEDVDPRTPDQMGVLITADRLGYYDVGFQIDPKDWSMPTPDEIVSRVISSAEKNNGGIIILHDGGGNRKATIEALPKMIEELKARGFKFVSLASLMNTTPQAIMPAISQKDRFLSIFNTLIFIVFYVINKFFVFFFSIGIGLGLFRSLTIGTLAIIQNIFHRHRRKKIHSPQFLPEVSVVIPAFNEENVIVSTVNSILESNYSNLKIIVVNDGSTDETLRKLRDAFSDNRYVNILTKPNSGKADALNLGISKTDAEFIVTLDADTIFLPDTISHLISNFSSPKVGAVAGNAKVGNRINILTRWQALEYITSQNTDRRAFDLINTITVVPGAVGAWRREAIIKAGGFSNDTLTEDADLTFLMIRQGYRIVYADEAIALTEAPDTVINFLKQRFRWMYGMLQTAWKHKNTVFHWRYKALGFVSVPNILIFQIFFTLISPIIDLSLFGSAGWALWQHAHHPMDYSSAYALHRILDYYLIFLAVDFMSAAVAFLLERKRENWKLLLWLPFQRFIYRQFMYYISYKAVTKAIKGKQVHWGKFERKATVDIRATQAYTLPD